MRKDVSDHRKELSFRPILKIHDNKNIAVYFAINMNSFILTTENQLKELMTLCEFPIDQKWVLIYRGSQDGFEAGSFHIKCDYKPNTLIIVKSTNGNVFGGYTEQSWEHIGNYKADPSAFIFSLINSD